MARPLSLSNRPSTNDVETEAEWSIFLSAAHGRADIVEQLIASGRVQATLALPLELQAVRGRATLVQRVIALHVALHSETRVTERDVILHQIDGGVRSRGGTAESTSSSSSLTLVSFSIVPSDPGEGMSAELVRQRVASLSFATGVLRSLESVHGDEVSVAELREETVVGAGGVGWDDVGAGVGLGSAAAGFGSGRGPRGEGLVGEAKCVQYDVNAVDELGCSALHWAALNDRMPVINALLERGIRVDTASNEGQTALHWAALKGHIRATDALCRASAEVNAVDKWGFSALMRAAQGGHIFVVLLLLRFGADASIADHEGHRALHWAVFHRHHTVVEWLLKEGSVVANINEQDHKGKTPLHLAAAKSGREMVHLLSVCTFLSFFSFFFTAAKPTLSAKSCSCCPCVLFSPTAAAKIRREIVRKAFIFCPCVICFSLSFFSFFTGT
jgi:hypothetical protein